MFKMSKETYIRPKTLFFGTHASRTSYYIDSSFKLKIQANYQKYKHLTLLNISNKYQSLLRLNAIIIDATQKKLLAKMWIILAYGKFPCMFIRSRSFRNNKFFITHL